MRDIQINQPIDSITIWNGNFDHTAAGAMYPEAYRVGFDGVTLIEPTTKCGMHADIPYVRVWKGDIAVAEFCQHNIVGIYFAAVPATPA